MPKQSKQKPHSSKKSHPIKKRSQKSNPKEEQPNQLDDILAWGKDKQNYYQEQQNEYSELSEEQDEAKQIYQNQYENNLNQEEFYDLPEQAQQQEEEQQGEEDGHEGFISDQYVDGEIFWATELANLFETVQDQKSQFRKKVYDSYLIILMSLKQFKIPYVDQHPLVQNLPFLKKALQHFQKQIPKLQQKLMEEYEQDDNQEQQQISNQQQQEEDEQIEDIESEEQDRQKCLPSQTKSKSYSKLESQGISKGLDLYEMIKFKKEQQRKAKKAQNKKARQQNLPKQAFKLVGQNQGRLANQKILKNKGLMKRRQRGDGNSRVKLRGKYQKAIIKRRAKGIIGVKENPGRFYQGEDKVLYGKIASTKLK